ncbi:MAG: STAS domain-containing protein [Calditrichaeota bacterium]|nr:MAG: STAS domain-containing protein [Calditrichota bacterium]
MPSQPEPKPIVIIKVGGYIEFATSDELDVILQRTLKSNLYNIVIDLRDVTYISSRGWSIFLSRIKEIRDNGGDLKLANMSPEVFEVYKILEFFWFLKEYQSVAEAVADFDRDVPPMP